MSERIDDAAFSVPFAKGNQFEPYRSKFGSFRKTRLASCRVLPQGVTLNVTAIRNFKDERTAALFRGEFVKAFSGFNRQALSKLDQLENATVLTDLGSIRGNRLEGLKGARQGQFSIRINDQYRICFRWENGYALDVEIVDYH